MKWIKNHKFKKYLVAGMTSALGLCAICLCFFALNNMQAPTYTADNPSSQKPIINKSSVYMPNTSLDLANKTENSNFVDKSDFVSNENFEKVDNSNSTDIDENTDESEIRTADLFEASDASLFSFMQVFKSNNTQNGTSLYYWVENNSEKNSTLHIRNNSKTGYTEFDSGSAAPWVDDNQYRIKKVIIENEIQPSATIGWFGCVSQAKSGVMKLSNIKTIEGLNYLDMTNVKDATCMFVGSDLLDTPEVDSAWFSKISSSDVKLTNALGMCNYTSLDNTFLTNMARAVAPSVTNGSYAFANNNKNNLVSLDLSNVNFSSATDTSRMFYNNHDLKSIAALSLIATSGVETVNDMFTNCENLNFIGLAGGTNWQEKISQFGDKPFIGCKNLKNWEEGNTGLSFANNTTVTGYFSDITTKSEAYAVVNNNDMTFYYDNNKTSRTGTKYNIDLNLQYSSKTQNEQPYHVIASSVTSVTIDDTFANAPLLSTYNMFHNFSEITTISGLGNINVYNVTLATHMFDGCSSIKSFDFSTWNTRHSVYYVSNMFTDCNNVEEITIGTNWDINFQGTDLRPLATWYNKKTGDSYHSGSLPIYPVIKEITTYVTQLEKFDIILHSNNENWGTITTSDDDKKAHVGETIYLRVLPKTGCSLQNFTTVPEGLTITKDSTATDGYTFIMPAQAVDITANFTDGKDYWSITFSPVGVYGTSGGNVPQTVQVEKGKTYTFTSDQAQGNLTPPTAATSAGYDKFAGWCTVQNPTIVKPDQSTYYQYQNDEYSTTITPTGNITLYAQWRKRVNLKVGSYMYIPIFKCIDNNHPIDDLGYHFYKDGTTQEEITSDDSKLYRMKDLDSYVTNQTLYVEVDLGKGAIDTTTGQGTGKCIAFREGGQLVHWDTNLDKYKVDNSEYFIGKAWTNPVSMEDEPRPYIYWKDDSQSTSHIYSADVDVEEVWYKYTNNDPVYGTQLSYNLGYETMFGSSFLWSNKESGTIYSFAWSCGGKGWRENQKNTGSFAPGTSVVFSRIF